MAKKKRETEDWKEPEFDEVNFMRGEIRLARAAIVTVLWAIPAALIGYSLTVWNPVAGSAIAFLAGLGMLYILRWVFPRVGVVTEKFKRRDWVGHTASYLFSWLAFWILLLNPPFADLTAPTITTVTVNGSSVSCGGSVAARGSILLNVTAADNVGVAGVTYSLGTNSPSPLSRVGNLWQASFTASTIIIAVTIFASDATGRSTSCGFTLDAR